MKAVRVPLRIAIGGRMQVGKTTAADRLVARHGFAKYALAAPIKEIARSGFGWDGRKDALGRRLLQEIGTVGRHYDSEIWLDRFAATLAADDPPRAVVDDLRLAREEEYLRQLGFVCILVTRPERMISAIPEGGETAGHETETEIGQLEVEAEIDNSGTFEELYGRLDRLVAELEIARA
jgi:hypothetical protein